MKTVLTPLIPSPVGRGETKPDRRPPSPERRGGQGVRTPERRRGLRVRSRPLAALAALVVATGCRSAPPTGRYDPAHDLGTLFHDVQLSGLFTDSKTLADARPRLAPAEITARYGSARGAPQFNLRQFVEEHFELPRPVGAGFRSDTSQTMEQHIRALWPVLTRPPDTADARSSLIPLPNPYVVPGGRFREVYYWDSYFTMLALSEGHRRERLGLLEPLDARPERPAHARDHRPNPGGLEQSPLSRRADDRRAAGVPRTGRGCGGRETVHPGRRGPSSGPAGGCVRSCQRVLLRCALAQR